MNHRIRAVGRRKVTSGEAVTASGPDAPAPRARPRAATFLAVLVGALVLAGCSIVSGLIHTSNDLRSAGFTNPSVKIGTQGSLNTVSVNVGPASNGGTGTQTLDAQAENVAQIVWDDLPGRFDLLTVNVSGMGSRRYTHAQLVSQFGARPNNLDAQSLSGELGSAARNVAIVVGVVLLLVVVVVVLILVLGRRRRKQQQQAYEQLLVSTLPPDMWGYVAPQYGMAPGAYGTPGGAPGAYGAPGGAPGGYGPPGGAYGTPGGAPGGYGAPETGWPPPQPGWPPPQPGWPPAQPGFAPPPADGTTAPAGPPPGDAPTEGPATADPGATPPAPAP